MKLIASAVLALCTAAPAYAANTFACQNVKDYGALGNNATDDTAAVKSAFTAAAAGTIVENGTTISKGCVYFPAGVYVVSSTITVPDRISVYGDGEGGVLGPSDDSPGASVVRGTMNAPILNFANNRFTLRDLGIVGPNNPAYTSSVCVNVGPKSAFNFDILHVFVSACYDGMLIDGAFNGNLHGVTAQRNHHNGIRALSAQGSWNSINVTANGGDGVYIGLGSINKTASPWITNLQTWDNGGYGVNAQEGGLSLTQFFINNDYLGGIYVGPSALSVQLASGQVQYSGLTSSHGTNASAAGIKFADGYSSHAQISGLQFFDDQGNNIDIASAHAHVSIASSTFLGAGRGGIIGNQYAIKSVGEEMTVSGINTNQPVMFSGRFSTWGNSWISSNSSLPTFHVAGGTNHAFTGLNIYQNSTGKAFVSAPGTSYTIAATQVYGGSQSSGVALSSFNGSP